MTAVILYIVYNTRYTEFIRVVTISGVRMLRDRPSLCLTWFQVEEWFTVMPGLNVEDLVMEGVWQVALAGILHLWLRAYTRRSFLGNRP